MEKAVEIIDKKVEDLKNTEVYFQLEREINEMLDRLIRSITSENSRLKKQNEALKNVVKNTMKEKKFGNFHI